ncbi:MULTISPECIES: mannonate dehydratase [Rhodomicrobium]|uniref:mannonate dehydratase n=1 Tax=Rhodomicrobium TaxID=1068 RepID=UPI000B4B58EF|nr:MULTISPECIES: mannonate dehydratase [Rhodomicrobium]
MRQGWRWFGPNDPVSLRDIGQAGATDIVTALHEKYEGQQWTLHEVLQRKTVCEAKGFVWSVCESIPIPTAIKTGAAGAEEAIETWKASLHSLGVAGIPLVCFNFMPVVDWTRTKLDYAMPNGALALRFEMVDFVAYDVHVLKRPGAEADYSSELLDKAARRFAGMSAETALTLEHNIISGLPGGEGHYTRETLRKEIARYDGIDADALRRNLIAFLSEVVPVAEASGVTLVIHPDDPPFPLFGLPRVVSGADDLRALFAAVPSRANGMTLCAGSYGSGPQNDVVAMAREFAERIHFAHLRNVTIEPDGSFTESDHLGGRVDMVGLIDVLLAEERRRKAAGMERWEMVMRPDHGHVLIDDIGKKVNPGYSCIGRLKGLAELRGVITALGHPYAQ